jgi:hypothetical protein
LSGDYDLSDREGATKQFIDDAENYTNTCVRIDPNPDNPDQKKVSPVARVTTPTETVPFIPMYLINSDGDPMPPHQLIDLQCTIQNAGVDSTKYKILTLQNNTKHAFAYWDDYDGATPQQHRVRDDVVGYLDTYLK